MVLEAVVETELEVGEAEDGGGVFVELVLVKSMDRRVVDEDTLALEL